MAIKIKWQRTPKQVEAWEYLTDAVTTLLFFGGGAGGAKSFLGCAWLILMCIKFPKTRWFLARRTLKDLKESTLETFFEVCEKWGIKSGKHFKYNGQDGYILFKNGAKIVLKELKPKPSDPNYEGVGSTEYTGGFIDESPQVPEKAVDVMMSRCRFKLDDFGICQHCRFMGAVPVELKPKPDKFGVRQPLENEECPKCSENKFNSLIPKILLTGNPSKNWIYREFYLPTKALITGVGKKIEPYKKFIQALVTDNPFASRRYIENLRKLKNVAMFQRLFKGNWEWDDDEAKLMDYGKIVDIFSNNISHSSDKFISCDVARRGKDQSVVILWHGMVAVKIIILPKDKYYKTTQISAFLKKFSNREKVPRSNIVIDEGGVGGGVVDEMEETDGHNQVFAFNGASSPIQPDFEDEIEKQRGKLNYGNLRAQCYDALGNSVNDSEISVITEDTEVKDLIIEELGQVKQKDIDKDGKFFIIPKDEIKSNLGRSPDLSDSLMMRFVFNLDTVEEDLIEDVAFDF